MKFVDIAEIKVKAGDGGTGMSHFRREKFVPAGGPDGGNGGNGGSIYLSADEGLSTLLDFHSMRFYEAERGGKGGINNRQGKNGKDLFLKVPCGTVVKDLDSDELIGEVLTHGQTLLVAHGGRGGVGNALFATSRNQAPTRTIPPQPGELKLIKLELKMIADVGIIGAPNAGKSTLITLISAARPKVADYPFTTLVPTLDVVKHKQAQSFVASDIPGLIAGASKGKGLGYEFLRHIERTKVIIHLVDGSQESSKQMIQDYEEILHELRLYNADILTRPRLTVISKLDFIFDKSEEQISDEHSALAEFEDYLIKHNVNFYRISIARRGGIEDLLDAVIHELSAIAGTNASGA
jgi:GTP-binding protein